MGEHVIDLGPRVPRTAPHPVLRWLAQRILSWMGWRLDMHLPDEPKMVVLGAPHTSNWEGVLAVLAVLAMELRIGLFVKHTAFKNPVVGRILRGLDAVPIDRSARGGVVTQTVAAFRARDQLAIAIAPEGTRRRVEKWKRGFYLIAQEAGVPIVCAYVDYRRKVVGTGPVLRASGDYARDLETIQAFYRGIVPKHPGNFAAQG
jgi:1-acyl-sn-glycerol-3-phosphate acyltransferase